MKTTFWVALLLFALPLCADEKKPRKSTETDWTPLFDGKSLKGWTIPDFSLKGDVEVKNNQIIIGMGDTLSGVLYDGDVPKSNYEISLDTMRLDGHDFFCGLTFPVGDVSVTLVVGGWGGATVGISSIDGNDASENETTKYVSFDSNKWYRVRVRVTKEKIEAWLDDDKIVDVAIKGKTLSMRPGEIEKAQPFSISTFRTKAALKDIRIRKL